MVEHPVTHDWTPHSLDAERSVLGAMLIDPDHIITARSVVSASDFFRVAHQTVYAAILALFDRKVRPDIVTLINALREGQTLEDVGGPAYVSALVDGIPFTTNVTYYAGIVRAHSLKRQLIQTARSLEGAAQNTDATVDELLDTAQAALSTIGAAQGSDLTNGTTLASEATAWLGDVQARRQKGRSLSGVSSGLRDLDMLTDGFQPGDLIVIAARPSQGKTALALQLALSCDGPVAFFSLEMRRAQLATRALAWLARIDGWSLRTGRLADTEYERVSRALTSLADSGLAIDDASDLTVWQIRSKARRWKVQHGLSMVVIDYLQLVTPASNKRRQQNREQDVAAMSRSLKGLAKDLEVPVILLAQLNRAVEGRSDAIPKLSDLRESGAIEQDADLVLFLHRPGGKSVKDEGEAHVILAKQRNGPIGTVTTIWRPSMTRFDPAPTEWVA